MCPVVKVLDWFYEGLCMLENSGKAGTEELAFKKLELVSRGLYF